MQLPGPTGEGMPDRGSVKAKAAPRVRAVARYTVLMVADPSRGDAKMEDPILQRTRKMNSKCQLPERHKSCKRIKRFW